MPKSILVVDDMAVLREPLAASLRAAGYRTEYASDGDDALRLTRTVRPDVILLDIAMPKMDGITFLKRLRSEPTIAQTHVILLTAHCEKHRILAAAALGVRDYVLKSHFHLAELLDRIKKVSAIEDATVGKASPSAGENGGGGAGPSQPRNAPVEVPGRVSRQEIVERIRTAFDGKTLSGVVMEVIAKASSSRGDATDLATLISRDTLLSARVLQAANSALYLTSGGRAVSTIPTAINKIGYSAVRNIAAAVGVFDCMPDCGNSGFNPVRCWQHSLAVAQLCQLLTDRKSSDLAALSYLVGLCHELGDIFINTHFPQQCRHIAEISLQAGVPVQQLAAQTFGMTSAQIAGEVLRSMAVPEDIRIPIEAFHAATDIQSANNLSRILWIADNFANSLILASSASARVAPISQSLCRDTVSLANPPIPEPQAFRAEILSLTVTLAKLPRKDELSLMTSMFKMRPPIDVWVARDERISKVDPITETFKSLVTVTISNRLPTSTECERIGGLVVVAASPNTAELGTSRIEDTCRQALQKGKTLPVLALCCKPESAASESQIVMWRPSLALSEISTFVDSLEEASFNQAAA